MHVWRSSSCHSVPFLGREDPTIDSSHFLLTLFSLSLPSRLDLTSFFFLASFFVLPVRTYTSSTSASPLRRSH
ncbi:hypothetical protein BO79DRAFT_36200 [Aspergillus costaricaensis CBS 115574]|uniref:Uncharacterized protein n=1 Tax=Aspergillus costaricaensis CBS 115574 TaxID=1448317 RepID=A0ACD1I9F2_9EURO|nr:hypothetical protein BO79DRAFT_36200 [Aspergillus costaricaensis CBS 115574]RAK86407.1 hypothetical protein BO79DRAFT_36200 [Aspergillus costaricaensis CBS 115574]